MFNIIKDSITELLGKIKGFIADIFTSEKVAVFKDKTLKFATITALLLMSLLATSFEVVVILALTVYILKRERKRMAEKKAKKLFRAEKKAAEKKAAEEQATKVDADSDSQSSPGGQNV